MNEALYRKKNVLDPIYKWILLQFMVPAKWLRLLSLVNVCFIHGTNTVKHGSLDIFLQI